MTALRSTLLHSIYLLIVSVSCIENLDFELHDYEAMTSILKKWNETTSNSSMYWNLSSIGKSVWDKQLWVLEISAAPKNASGIPNLKLIGNMHADYPEGKEVLLHFIEYLMSSYGKDEKITRLLDTTRIYVLPNMNPDDKNSVGLDLNKNFPDYYQPNNPPPIQPETVAIMNWMTNIPFILSATLDGSAIVAIYPLNSRKEYNWKMLLMDLRKTNDPVAQKSLRDQYIESFEGWQESLSEDNDVFVHLAKLYSNTHTYMHEGEPCPNVHQEGNWIAYSYPGGIINGANTSRVSPTGAMQDYNYFKHGCMELNLMIHCPGNEDDTLEDIWDDNLEALVQYALQANRGVHGIIKDFNTHAPLTAKLSIEGRNVEFNTTKDGEFWRILLPGAYNLKVSSEGYYSKTVPFTIVDTGRFPELVHLSVFLLNSTIPTTPATVQTTSMTEDFSGMMTTTDDEDFDYRSSAPQTASVRSSTSSQYVFNISLSLLMCVLLGRFVY